MTKHTTKITSKSIAKSGLPSDYKRAIAEYIWNGFDANASSIDIDFNTDELGYLKEFSISDNGDGISFETISETFGSFMVSQKTSSYSDTAHVKGKKGKGRFSFFNFCNKTIWETVFKTSEDKLLEYTIEIAKDDSQNFETNDTVISKKRNTGTRVLFKDFTSLSEELLQNEELTIFLCNEFGWFLHLNKSEHYSININGVALNYSNVVEDSEEFNHEIQENIFKINFIRWKDKFGDKYYSYFLDSNKNEKYRRPTSFNNKSIGFHHSIYIESIYFDNFKENKVEGNSLFGDISQFDQTFKSLVRFVTDYIADKEKTYVKHQKANALIEEYNKKNIFPEFKKNDYEQLRKKDLENVIKEIYSVQPKIFQNLKIPQSKALVGFLNLLLDSEQRENILDIISNIVKLSDEDRKDLSNTLKKTEFTHINALIKFLENRFNVVEILKTLIYDLEKFTNEREHIQKVIESNYWLFGEQYHIVSGDKNFETLLNNYLDFLEKNDNKKPNIHKLEQKEKLRRPDIFICQKADIPDVNTDLIIEENIIVELKRPEVIIGKKQFSQIEDYLGFISNEDKFNSELRQWKFIIVGKSVDSYIKGLYKNQEVKGKKFLVQSIDKYEIFAMTWDDLFRIFNIKHKHLIDKLEFKSSVIEELHSKGINFSRDDSNKLTKITLKKVP